MKQRRAQRNIQVSGVEETTTFNIEMGAKAFQVLSSGLYENKIGSLVREIACNAVDSHIQAGTPERPIVIHVPDSLEPYFSVQDFGVGLSPQQIKEVYTVLFKSTKDQTNDMTGAFGLGSKTPFSYDDRFNITSVYNGTRTEYTAYLDEDGVPRCDKLVEVDCADGNGVTVTVNAKEDDFYRFRNEITSQLKFFPVKPKLINADGLEFDELSEPAMSFDGLDMLNHESMYIIQGGVGYPADYYQLRDLVGEKYQESLSFLERSGCRMYFNIGEIDVTASREGVEYNDHTIASIKKKLESFRKNAKKHMKKIIKEAKNDWELASKLNDNSILTDLMNQADIDLKKNTTLVRRGSTYRVSLTDAFVEEKEVDIDGKKVQENHVMFKLMRYVRHGDDAPRIDSNASTDALTPRKDVTTLYVKDTNFKPLMRMKKHVLDNDLDEMFVIVPGSDNDNAPADAFPDDTLIDAVGDLLNGALKIRRVSDLEAPETTKNSAFRAAIPTCYKNTGSTWVSNWLKVTDNADVTPSVYLTVDRLSPTDENGDSDDIRIFNELRNVGVIDNDVDLYAFNIKNSAKLSDEWVTLSDYIAEKREMIKPHMETIERHDRITEIHEMLHNVYGGSLNSMFKKDTFIDGSTGTMNKFARALKASDYMNRKVSEAIEADKYKEAYDLKSIFQLYDNKFRGTDEYNELRQTLKNIKKEFELLDHLNLYYSSKDNVKLIEHIVRYVNCVS